MRGLLRYPGVAYLLGVLRERMRRRIFAGQAITRVLVCGEGMEPVARRLFPEAAPQDIGGSVGLWAVRRARFDAACIAMTGGDVGRGCAGAGRCGVATAAGALARLRLPTGDACGAAVWVWAIGDRFLLAPLALVWLVLR